MARVMREVTLRFKTDDSILADSLLIAWLEDEGITIRHASGQDDVSLTYVKTREL